jgi:translation initiation factor 3 subunit B
LFLRFSSLLSSYAFIEYSTPEEAAKAIVGMNGAAIDKQHTARVCSYTDYERLAHYSESFVPPVAESVSDENPREWLIDEEGRDQLVVRHAVSTPGAKLLHETEIYWNDALRNGRVLAYGGESEKERGVVLTELYVQWSPRGRYLVTFHVPGVMLRAGAQFAKVGTFAHNNVKLVDFSPCERFLVTCNGEVRSLASLCLFFWT